MATASLQRARRFLTLAGRNGLTIKAGRIRTTYPPGIKMLLLRDHFDPKLGSVATGGLFGEIEWRQAIPPSLIPGIIDNTSGGYE